MTQSRHWRSVFLLVAVTVAAYVPALGCGFIWDDDYYVTQNPVLRTAAGIWRIWFEPTSLPQYYPMVHTSFWLEYRVWGPWAPGYHALNVMLHATSVVLLWRMLRRLSAPGALFAAALLAVHPVHVESVAWVTERKNVLSLCCYLLAADSWLRWQHGGGRFRWWLGLGQFVGALLSKTVTASLPAALLVVVWWQHGKLSRRDVTGLLPWCGIALALGWVTVHLESTHVGASGAAWQLAGLERVLVAGRAAWFYLGSLLWPFGLCFNYPRWQVDTAAPWQWLFPLAALTLVGLTIAMRRRVGRGPAAALLLYFGTLVPALGFFDVFPFRYSYVADHFQYHASLAILASVAAVGVTLARSMSPAAGRTTAAAFVVGLAAMTSVRCRIYRDPDTLWQATLACNPRSTLALANLGAMANVRAQSTVARDYFERVLEIDPDNHEAVANLGTIAHRAGDRATARQRYEQALAMKPTMKEAMHNLAVLHLDEGRPLEAWTLLERAMSLDPDYYDARVTACRVLHDLRRWEAALQQADWVLARTPGASATRKQAVDCLLELGRHGVAASNAAAVLKQQPGDLDAQRQFARALAQLVRAEPAAAAGDKAIQGCRNAGVDAAALLPMVEKELRALGAMEQADRVAAAIRGG